jgi:hypothetical protein
MVTEDLNITTVTKTGETDGGDIGLPFNLSSEDFNKTEIKEENSVITEVPPGTTPGVKTDENSSEVIKEAASTTVDIDGVNYKLDDKGNAVSDAGDIFKTKEELDALATEVPEIGVIEEFITKSGFIPLDANGNPLVFEDTPEDLITCAQEYGKFLAKKENNELLERFPDAKEFLQHQLNGGTTENFRKFTAPDWKSIEITKDTPKERKLEIITANFKNKGFSEEKAKRFTEQIVAGGDLEIEAKEALQDLVKLQEDAEEITKAQLKAQALAYEAKQKETWDAIETAVIKKGVIKNFLIPAEDREKFYNYIGKPLNTKGETQAVIDETNEDLETSLVIDFLRYKKFDLKTLINNIAITQKVQNLRSRLSNKTTKDLTNGSTINQSDKTNVKVADGLSLESLFK